MNNLILLDREFFNYGPQNVYYWLLSDGDLIEGYKGFNATCRMKRDGKYLFEIEGIKLIRRWDSDSKYYVEVKI